MQGIKPVASLKEFFKDSVADAMTRQRVDADDHTAYYVVNLLTIFARSEVLFDDSAGCRKLKPVAKVLAEAVDSDRVGERNHALQRVGDVSLFVAGFLGEGFTARLVDTDYYVRVGGLAYSTLAHNLRGSQHGAAFGPVFTELADKFSEFVDVLADIRDDSPSSQRDLLQLYETWSKTGSKRAARLLRNAGIEPCRTDDGATQH